MATINGLDNFDDNISSGGIPSSDTLFSSTFGGNDTVSVFSSHYDVHLGDGNDVLSGGIGGQVFGEAGSDRMDAFLHQAGAHAHYGGDGDDRFNVFYGAAGVTYSAFGGLGTDQFVDYSSALASVAFDGGDGFDVVTHSGTTAIELTLEGTGHQGAGLKSYTGIEGVVGGLGDDTMTGSRLGNLMVGGNGADLISGGAGDDFLIGEARDVSFIRAYIGLNPNFSTLDAFDPLNANVAGTYASDGGGLNDTLNGGNGNDVLSGGDGADLLNGGKGIDWVSFLSTPDGAGVSMSLANGGTLGHAAGDVYVLIENVQGSGFNDTLGGDGGDNELRGMRSQDSLFGLAGNDTLIGGEGRDTLAGGKGSDLLTGGDWEDAFVFSGPGTLEAVDTITDFQVNYDEIWLSNAIFRRTGLAGVGLSVDAFVIGSAAVDRSDRIIYDSGTGALLYDADGSKVGAAVQFAQLATGLALTAGDFVII